MTKLKDLILKEEINLEENLSVTKLKRMNLVDDDDWGKFIMAIRKMDADKPLTRVQKDMFANVFNKLIDTIMDDPAILQKVIRANK